MFVASIVCDCWNSLIMGGGGVRTNTSSTSSSKTVPVHVLTASSVESTSTTLLDEN